MMKFPSIEDYLQEKKKFVDSYLDKIWEEIAGEGWEMQEELDSIYPAMRYSAMAEGKRLRPILAMAASETLGKPGEEISKVACALELIHTYSLVHDDLPAMDDDDLRRGKPTCHKVFGEDMAILAGDALLTYAFELLSQYGQDDPEAGMRIIQEVSRSAGPSGMIGGQVLDVKAEGREVTPHYLEETHRRKTAELIRASVLAGALAAGAERETLERLERFALYIGLAFQVADDLLNVSGNAGDMGKKTGTDRERGKATYPLLLGEKKARRKADELYNTAVSELDELGENFYLLKQLAYKMVYRSR